MFQDLRTVSCGGRSGWTHYAWRHKSGKERERDREGEMRDAKDGREKLRVNERERKRERGRDREITDGQWQSFLWFSPLVRQHSRLSKLAINPLSSPLNPCPLIHPLAAYVRIPETPRFVESPEIVNWHKLNLEWSRSCRGACEQLADSRRKSIADFQFPYASIICE